MDYFKEELALIKNEKIREKCEAVLERVNEKFFHEPASSTGKYHPDYALGEGGLYRHTRAAVKIANELLQLEMYNNFSDNEKDFIICALILHDTCKSGIDWDSKYTKHTHPLDAGQLIYQVTEESDNGEFGDCVATLVESHMGQWNTCKWDKHVLPKPETEAQKFVHLCDYLASRKFLECKFD